MNLPKVVFRLRNTPNFSALRGPLKKLYNPGYFEPCSGFQNSLGKTLGTPMLSNTCTCFYLLVGKTIK